MTPYEECGDGPFYPMREHATKYGWAVVHAKTGAIVALVGAKGVAFGLSAAMNQHWESARIFIEPDVQAADDAYWSRFVEKPR